MSTVVLLAIPDVGLVLCGMKSTAEEVSKKVEQAVPMLIKPIHHQYMYIADTLLTVL